MLVRRVVIAAARAVEGVQCVGLEHDVSLVQQAARQLEGLEPEVRSRVELRQADVLGSDFSEASVVFLYLMGSSGRPSILELHRQLELQLLPDCRIVTACFPLPRPTWETIEHVTIQGFDLYLQRRNSEISNL